MGTGVNAFLGQGMQPIPVKSTAPVPTDYNWSILAQATMAAYPDPTQFADGKWPIVANPANLQSVPTTLTLNDNWTVATGFVAGTANSVAPVSAKTPHGTWGSASMTPPVVSTLTSASGAITTLGTVQLDTYLGALLYKDGATTRLVGVNLGTGQQGASQQMTATYNGTPINAIFKVSTTSGFVVYGTGAATTSYRAFSVDASTLALTLGAALSPGLVVDCIQIDAAVYCFELSTSDVFCTLVSGIALTTGATSTATANGDAVQTGLASTRIIRSSATEVLIAMLAAGGATSTTRAVAARIGSISLVTGNIALNGLSTSASNVNRESLRVLISATDGLAYCLVCQDGTATTGNYFGVSVAGTVATVGAIAAKANNLPAAWTFPGTWIYKQTGVPAIKYNATTFLFGHLTTGVFAVTIAGTTLTFGATLAFAAAKLFVTDFTGTVFFALSTALIDKITVAGAVAASAYQIALTVATVISESLTDSYVKYNDTQYNWTLAANQGILTPTLWMFTSGNNINLNGPVY